MATPYIGASIKRQEDYRFLTGSANYTDDVACRGKTHAHFVRSPHAHGRSNRSRRTKRSRRPGSSPSSPATTLRGPRSTACPALAHHRRHVPADEGASAPLPCPGQRALRRDHVAIVIAETTQQARDRRRTGG